MNEELEKRWSETVAWFEERFGGDLDLDGILFLIGIQELGQGPQKFSKDQKLDVMHIAVCTLLEPFGYYKFEGEDPDGWPHFTRLKKLPSLKPGEQDRLMRSAIADYVDQYRKPEGA